MRQAWSARHPDHDMKGCMFHMSQVLTFCICRIFVIKNQSQNLWKFVSTRGYAGLYNQQSANGNHFKGYYSIQLVSKDWSVLLITLSFLAFDLYITQALFG